MDVVRKLMICQYFGDLPSYWPLYQANVARLERHGYDFHFEFDLGRWAKRAARTLGVCYPAGADPRKPCTYRVAFGEMFADLIAGYDFWGHTDLDCLYGRVENYVTDDFLAGLDVHANHVDYLCGPWTLYRNRPLVNGLFRRHGGWREILEDPLALGWGETGYTRLLDSCYERGELRRRYTYWQTRDQDSFDTLRWEGEALMEGGDEVMMAHFSHAGEYPPGCLA